MTQTASSYELYYWPFLPGRGEFVRLVLEETEAGYRDVAREAESPEAAVALIGSVRGGDLGGLRPYAPPVLKQGDLVLAQTAVICSYLGEKHGLVAADEASVLGARQLQMSLCDVADEAHNTHHPISAALAYEEQSEAARDSARSFVSHRLPAFLRYLEKVADAHVDVSLLPCGFTYVDLSLFQLLEGLRFAFPAAMRALAADSRKINAIASAVARRPSIASYLASPRRMAFNNHGVFRNYPELDFAPE